MRRGRIPKGMIKCPECDGSGEVEVDCPRCGNCDYFDVEDDNVIPMECPVCGDRGTIMGTCPTCDGTGLVEEDDDDDDDGEDDE